MNKLSIVTCVIALAAGAAQAEGPLDYPGEPPMTQQLSRAQVRAEVLAERAQGRLHAMVGEDSGSFYLAANDWREPAATRLAARTEPKVR